MYIFSKGMRKINKIMIKIKIYNVDLFELKC